jgi:hypothetical protein
MGTPIKELSSKQRAVCLRRLEFPAAPLTEIAEAFGYSYKHTSRILCSSAAKEYMRDLEDRMVTESIRGAAIVPYLPGVSDSRRGAK